MESNDDVTALPEAVNGHVIDYLEVDDLEETEDHQRVNNCVEYTSLDDHNGQGTSDSGCPNSAEQLSLIEATNAQLDDTYLYAVSKRWLRRWHDHVTGNSMADAPGPLEMDRAADNEMPNEYVPERVWRLLSGWYGVAPEHLLDRKHSAAAFNDHAEFETCTLSAFSGIVDHVTRTFNRFEEVGYVEFQLRRMFQVTSGGSTSTRLWLSERELMPPRFRLLTNRNRMLKDGLRRDRTYILALEVCRVVGATDSWPTGESGSPVGDMEKYFSLAPPPKSVSQPATPTTTITDCLCYNGLGLEQVASSLLDEGRQCLQDREDTLRCLSTRIEARTKDLDALETALIDRTNRVTTAEKNIEGQRQAVAARISDLDASKSRLSRENELIEQLKSRQLTRLRLDVGGTVFVTSRRTLIDRDRKSLLAAMFADDDDDAAGDQRLKPEPDSSFFVDRDGVYFRYVMEWLRQGDEAELPKHVPTLRHILCEAKYYRLQQFVKRIEDQLTQLNASIM